MRSRLLQLQSASLVAVRSTLPAFAARQPLLCLRLQKRFITAKERPLPTADKPGLGPNQDQLPHISEEAAATSKITGDEAPDLEQGTPVQEILKRDENSHVKPPKIMIQEEKQKSTPKGSRSFSTVSRRREDLTESALSEERTLSRIGTEFAVGSPGHIDSVPELPIPETLSQIGTESAVESPGHIYGVPELPIPETDRLKHRYDPLVLQFTNLIMQHGKKGLAQRNVALILNYLRTTAPPKVDPNRLLLEEHSSATRLPLDPVRYLKLAIDSIAPVLRLRSQRGAAGGGQALQLPVPLRERQRRRHAIRWILAAVDKKQSKGSGRTRFAQKVAEELVAIVEGRSGLWERRGSLHKQGVSARTNLTRKFRP